MPPDPLQLSETGEDWREPDGTATGPGPHPHYALWDHLGHKWDAIPYWRPDPSRGYAVIDLLMGAIAGFVIGLLAGRLV